MEFRIFKNISIEAIDDQLMSFDVTGVVKYNHSTSAYQLITVKNGTKALNFDIDGNISLGNAHPTKEFTINFEEAR